MSDLLVLLLLLSLLGGDNEVQRTMLQIVTELDGFDARGISSFIHACIDMTDVRMCLIYICIFL